jgi:uncharacterized protein YndB with AHSA1/START domain
MNKPQFIYVTYISASAEDVWKALVDPGITTKYWQHVNLSDWKVGSNWEHRETNKDGQLKLVGKVMEANPPRRLVFSWANPDDIQHEERHSRVAFEIESVGKIIRLTVIHDQLRAGSEMLDGITQGWPKVLSSLKSLLEVGKPLPKLW